MQATVLQVVAIVLLLHSTDRASRERESLVKFLRVAGSRSNYTISAAAAPQKWGGDSIIHAILLLTGGENGEYPLSKADLSLTSRWEEEGSSCHFQLSHNNNEHLASYANFPRD